MCAECFNLKDHEVSSLAGFICRDTTTSALTRTVVAVTVAILSLGRKSTGAQSTATPR